MFKNIIISLILLSSLPFLTAQNWFSKAWHNSVSHYNYYYNANVLVQDAKLEAYNGYKDNFKNVLLLYPYPDEVGLKGNTAKMDNAIKKLSRIIDKHKVSKWVDDSYLLMADARFFKGDFYAALENYEYVISSFKNSKAAQQAEINIIKTYLKLEKYDDAEALYNKLKIKKNLHKSIQLQVDLTGASVNIAQKKYVPAIKLLENALPKIKKKDQKIRANFVLAQLYVLTKNNQQGIERYKKVIKLNPKYEFAFNAKLNIAKAINIKNKGEVRDAIEILKSMLKDDKNIDFFAEIYYELGNLELALKNTQLAIEDYSRSLRSLGGNNEIKSNTYLALAEIYFKNQDYENAQVYFDSAAKTVDEKNPLYESIQKKNSVLNELIKHLVNIKTKDSILKLADNEKLREKTINNLIKQAKEKVEADKKNEDLQKLKQNDLNAAQGSQASANTLFPFYNQAARTKGFQDFNRIWGDRKLMDFWAISSNKTAIYKEINDAQSKNDFGMEEKKKIMDGVTDERKKYYENIPFTLADKNKMKDDISESYFLGANVYYQNLKETEKAKKMLEEMNSKYPKTSFEINAWFLLAKIYKEQNNIPKYDFYYNLILKKDDKSNFLKVLDNLGNQDSTIEITHSEQKDKVLEDSYLKIYNAYKAKKYDEVLALKAENDLKFPGNSLQVNFDYLEAMSIGEKGDLIGLETKLTAIVANYPTTEIAKLCEEIIKKLRIKRGDLKEDVVIEKFKTNKAAEHLYILLVPKGIDFTKIKIAYLNRVKENYAKEELRVTNSLLGGQQMLIVNNFKTFDVLSTFLKDIIADPMFKETLLIEGELSQYLISKENFSILLNDSKIDDYAQFYLKNYKL